MTDYSTMTKEELQALQIQKSEERDSINDECNQIQTALDTIQATEDAANAVSTMTPEERAAMTEALQNP